MNCSAIRRPETNGNAEDLTFTMSTDGERALHVLIVHFNTPDMTARLVGDIPTRTPAGRDVYIHIFDNCSSKSNLESLREQIATTPNLTLHESQENIGFGEGHNALVSDPSIKPSDLIWILNPDTRVCEDSIRLLERELDAGHYSVVSPLIFSGDESHRWVWYAGGAIDSPRIHTRHDLWGVDPATAPQSPFETEFITGAAPMMAASTFRAIGGFPKGYFLYWEDAYFSWKANQLGYRLGVVPRAQVWHAVGGASGSNQSPTFFYWIARNRFLFAADIGIPRWRLLVGSAGLETLRTIAKAAVEHDGMRPKTAAAIRGTVHGFRKPKLGRSR